MAEHYYTVGKHGPAAKETAPHGVRYLPCGEGDVWCLTATSNPGLKGPLTRWAPLPAPPTEEAPAPEPVARWTGMFGGSCGFIAYDEDTLIPLDVVDRACDALNTLDANGVAWGPGRPMQELPDGHEEYVLVAYTGDSGAPWSVAQGTTRANDVSSERLGWWPLPEVTP